MSINREFSLLLYDERVEWMQTSHTFGIISVLLTTVVPDQYPNLLISPVVFLTVVPTEHTELSRMQDLTMNFYLPHRWQNFRCLKYVATFKSLSRIYHRGYQLTMMDGYFTTMLMQWCLFWLFNHWNHYDPINFICLLWLYIISNTPTSFRATRKLLTRNISDTPTSFWMVKKLPSATFYQQRLSTAYDLMLANR